MLDILNSYNESQQLLKLPTIGGNVGVIVGVGVGVVVGSGQPLVSQPFIGGRIIPGSDIDGL